MVIAAINIRGIRQSSLVLNVLTIGKLLPLLAFVAVGIFFIDPALLVPQHSPSLAELSATGLLLIFAFGGYEVIPVPAGEARDPRRAVPFALIMTILIVTIVMTLVQVVAFGTLPGLAASRTPLADAAMLFMGGTGAALLTLGAVLSTTGNNVGQALSGSRNLFALAEQGDLPRFFGWVHPQFRTPVNAILVTSAVSLVLARVRPLFGPRARQRDQPPARLRRDVRVDDSLAVERVRRTRQPGDVRRAVRTGDPWRRHRPRPVDDRRRQARATHRGRHRAHRRGFLVRDRRTAGVPGDGDDGDDGVRHEGTKPHGDARRVTLRTACTPAVGRRIGDARAGSHARARIMTCCDPASHIADTALRAVQAVSVW